MTALRGVFPVLCSPFTDDGAVDVRSFETLIDFVMAAGVDGCVYPGVASEVEQLSVDERKDMVVRLSRRLDGRIPFIVGASAPDPDAVARHVRHGADAGAAAAMVMAPLSVGDGAAGQIAFFQAAAGDVAIPLMLQNAPVPIGAGLLPETVAEIARAVPAIRFVKEETMPCGQNIARLRTACGDGIDGVFGGGGGRYLIEELTRGALGTMPAAEFADVHVRLAAAWYGGDEAEARRIFGALLPALTSQAVFRMALTKEVLRRRGVIAHTTVRAWGPRMDGDDLKELSALIDPLTAEMTVAHPSPGLVGATA
ncbi:MAG: dihydrodipicolinate synthase family protein [Pseudomonadota bacterium]